MPYVWAPLRSGVPRDPRVLSVDGSKFRASRPVYAAFAPGLRAAEERRGARRERGGPGADLTFNVEADARGTRGSGVEGALAQPR